MRFWPFFLLAAALAVAAIEQSCTCRPDQKSITLDGSSTVYVISEAVAEEYQKLYKGRVSIGVSGTGGGFKKLCSGRIRIIGASRPINNAEQELCTKNNIVATEFSVALDGIVVAVNKTNSWAQDISVSTLKHLFEPAAENKIMYWSDLHQSWPKKKLAIFAPGIASGTYDYFTKTIVGREHASRGDITSSEDDNVLVHGVRSNPNSIGFFSFAYYQENSRDLKALSVENISPSKETIQNNIYKPLTRAVYIYANQADLNNAEQLFLKFYLENSAQLAADVGFIALSDEQQRNSLQKLAQD
jgi:phosphate transport system substrate-binding protein